MGRMTFLGAVGAAAAALMLAGAPARAAGCFDVSKRDTITLSGRLTYQIFPGPPNYEDVRKGDTPEPTYILSLNKPACFTGDDSVEGNVTTTRVHIYVADEKDKATSATLRQLVGKLVFVTTSDAFAGITGHHHAPIVASISSVQADRDITESYGTAQTIVEGFYQALHAGQGDQAAQFVVPAKRAKGPFSAGQLTSFYGSLKTPLSLIDVEPIGGPRYRARYNYVAADGRSCTGSAVVTTTKTGAGNLIAGIKAENGC